MTAAKKLSIPFDGKIRVHGHPKYWIDIYGNVFNHVIAFNDREYLRNVQVFTDQKQLKYCYLGSMKKLKNRHYIHDLLELCFPTGNLDLIRTRKQEQQSVNIVNRPTGESRVKLNRERVINLLLTYFKDQVQIPLTRNSFGWYETSEGMKRLGIRCCESCGEFNTDHAQSCSGCNEWLLKLPSR